MNFNTLQTLKIHQHLINSYIDLFIIHLCPTNQN